MGRQGGPGVPRLRDEGGPELHAGTGEDVRAVLARMPVEAKDRLDYAAVPWARFQHTHGPADDVPGQLERARTGDERESLIALGWLWSTLLHHGAGCAPGALAVPFLIRIAVTHPFHRAGLLLLAANLARSQHYGGSTGTDLLHVARPDDPPVLEASGHPRNWSAQAARHALALDADLLLPLLADPDPKVRECAAHALAAVSGRSDSVVALLHARLRVEDDPAVRACLVLAIGQLAVEERPPATVELMRAWWQDPARPVEVRFCAALSWLCLTDGPAPDDLRAFLDASASADLAALLNPTPWMRHVDHEGDGLRSCLRQVLRRAQRPRRTGPPA